MAQPLIVTRGTERLQVRLPDGCVVFDPEAVTLMLVRKGQPPCIPALQCPPDPCVKHSLQSGGIANLGWGRSGRCDCDISHCFFHPVLPVCAPCRDMSSVIASQPMKTYVAESVACGKATFLLDHDLTQAPVGWYLALVAIAECEAVALTVFVRDLAPPAYQCLVPPP